ncbi:DNA-directed RNA polymerase III, subunit Rpc31 [Corchorus olitorius]|uniref:DNA-directed RNA polymerase III, subunit Rpc31 n=1 Tax=Corchorus olitorius TaxID=93759 RepID=A0A1R3H7Z1_9ROSI|nr:DNA-directed RNA polymerase III, subunit Rpc31 [Corchorus olitorius]
MAFRGRGRGSGGYGRRGFYGDGTSKPFVLFPDVELPDTKGVLEDMTEEKSKSMDIERYSDWGNQKSSSKRDSLDQILQLHSNNFPKELIGDPRKAQRRAKKMRWNLDSGLEKLDKFEKFEQQFEDQDKEEKEKKSDDEEETDEESGPESDGSYSTDGDYNANEHFDDDEDDYNQDDGGDE